MTEDHNTAIDFVRHILEQICTVEEDIKIEVQEEEHNVTILASVNEADMGRVIGKEGQTINAMRTLLNPISARMQKKYFLKIES